MTDATKPRGTCPICGRMDLRLYRVGEVGPRQADGAFPGWVWGHGPREAPCPGSWQAPPADATDRSGGETNNSIDNRGRLSV